MWGSVDSGASWTQYAAAPSSKAWSSIVMDHTGAYLAATVDGEHIWTSTDSGTSWSEVQVGLPKAWRCSFANGTNLAAAAFNGIIVTSSNWGGSFVQVDLGGTRTWSAIAGSDDFGRLVAVENSGLLWLSTAASPLLPPPSPPPVPPSPPLLPRPSPPPAPPPSPPPPSPPFVGSASQSGSSSCGACIAIIAAGGALLLCCCASCGFVRSVDLNKIDETTLKRYPSAVWVVRNSQQRVSSFEGSLRRQSSRVSRQMSSVRLSRLSSSSASGTRRSMRDLFGLHGMTLTKSGRVLPNNPTKISEPTADRVAPPEGAEVPPAAFASTEVTPFSMPKSHTLREIACS